MIHEHNEIEIKLDGTGVDIEEFKQFVFKKHPNSFLCILGPDTYYENGTHVVRHRKSKRAEGGHELTVKRRKSERSTRDREEIDLFFDVNRTKQKDVEAFLAATGFTPVFTLTKQAHIFHVPYVGFSVSAVIYDVCIDQFDPDKTRRFIEVEVEKGGEISVDSAKRLLGSWVAELKVAFPALADRQPLNDSLYEIFSGKKYNTVD